MTMESSGASAAGATSAATVSVQAATARCETVPGRVMVAGAMQRSQQLAGKAKSRPSTAIRKLQPNGNAGINIKVPKRKDYGP